MWLNLEYLSAEAYVARCHALPSPVMFGPGQGLAKHFFYPGFTPDTGGLLREADLLVRQASFERRIWLAQHGIPDSGARLVSLFCYEPAGLPQLLQQLADDALPSCLLVTPGRATAALQQAIEVQNARDPLWNQGEKLTFFYLPTLSQTEFDHLLWACDINCVRGEDSLVRALWAGKPFLWHIYPQHDNAHHAKLLAFLDWLQAPEAWRQAQARWNGLTQVMSADEPLLPLQPQQLADGQHSVTQARQRLLTQHTLSSKLLQFIEKTH